MKTKKKKIDNVLPGEKQIKHPDSGPFEVGTAYLFRTVTMHLLGRVTEVGDREISVTEAGWLADSGRFHDFLKSGNPNEFEPAELPSDIIFIGRGAIVDVWPWRKELPKTQK